MKQLDQIEPNSDTRIQLVDCQNSRQPPYVLQNSQGVVYDRHRRLGGLLGCSTAFQQQAGNDGMGKMENNISDKLQQMRTCSYPSIIETILSDYIAHQSRLDKDQNRQLNQYVWYQQMQAAKPLSATLDQILLLAEMNKWKLKAEYIPGIQNRVPDSLSRIIRSGDYFLRKDVQQKTLNLLEIKLSMDTFATRLNRQHRVFCSYKPDKCAMAIDGLSIRWTNEIPLLSHHYHQCQEQSEKYERIK
ncbi:MAG: hypothetical protein EZS28_022244 [Streblomastix strix]|uniref:Uncharacterized protein n=1 Tax=Streblomastix strix TaxID=222440 RepID=A0A5J4VIA6_9EUKA|nr:MAG: hypothetical protein EZS28_022244 [Streblomastix strix]